jgi:hypothetical protein
MSEPRDIHVTLTFSELVALRACVSDELETLTVQDWNNGHVEDLEAADTQLQRAINRRNRRNRKAAA